MQPHLFDSKAVFRRLIGYILGHKWLAVFAVIFMVLTALTEASFAYMIKPITNDGFVNAKPWHLQWIALVLLGLMLTRAVVGYIANFLMLSLGRYVIFEIRQHTFARMIALPTSYFDKFSSSKNVSKLIYDAEAAALATTDTMTILFKDSVLTIALISYLIYLDWKLTLIFLVTVPVIVGVTHYSNTRFRKTSKEIQDSMGSIADTVKEASIGQKVIKVYGGQQQELENFTKVNRFNLKQTLKRARVSAAVVPVTMLAIAPAIALILHLYLNYLRTGPESAGQFMSYFAACMMLNSPLKKLAKVNEKLQIGLTAANSVFNVIDSPPEVDEGLQEVMSTRGNLEFKNVTFHYEYADSPDGHPKLKPAVIKNISFSIESGKRVALVGTSGSGKSTLTALILRFYTPQRGRITLDGRNINDLRLKDLRDQVALVSQETTLFDDTIGRNIMYGMLDDYDETRLKQAIKAAHVEEFLTELPDGLDTIVGEHGLRLSGGQRQRIAIARAIYKNAPILILDEATSALDNKSERYVQDALESLMRDRTSLVIAHRLSTVENADMILVLEEGEIVEQGTHKVLLNQGGVYTSLYKAQSSDKSSKRRFPFFK